MWKYWHLSDLNHTRRVKMAENDLSESKITNMDPVMEQIFTKMISCPGVGILKMIPCSAARPRTEKYMSTPPPGTWPSPIKSSEIFSNVSLLYSPLRGFVVLCLFHSLMFCDFVVRNFGGNPLAVKVARLDSFCEKLSRHSIAIQPPN